MAERAAAPMHRRPTDAAREWRHRHPVLAETALTLLVVIAVLCIAALHYRGQTLARGPDQADMLLAIFNEASRAIASDGLWAAMVTENLRAGIDNWANPNFHMLYPLYFNWAGADASPFATLDRLNAIIVLHLAILGAGGFALARALGVRLALALAVGLLLPWFPAPRSAAAWPHIIAAMAWLPWIIAAQVRLSTSDGRRDAILPVVGLVVAASLLVYANPAQNLVFAALASAFLWTAVLATAAWQRDPAMFRRVTRQCAWLAVAAVLVFAASGSYLVQVLEFHARSIRWLGEYGGIVVGNQPVPVGALRVHALSAADAGLLLAFEYRRGIGNAYLGTALLAATASLFALRKQGDVNAVVVRALVACALITTLFCFAAMAPLIVLLPLVNKVRELTWWSCLACVLVVPLAAVGLQAIADRPRPARLLNDPLAWWFGLALVLAAWATALSAAPRAEAFVALLAGLAAVVFLLRATSAAATAPSTSRVPIINLRCIACIVVLLAATWMPFRHNLVFAHRDATLFEADRAQARTDAAQLHALLPDAASYRIALGGQFPNAHLLTHTYAAAGFRAVYGGIGPDNADKYALLSTASPSTTALYGLKYVLVTDADARPGDRRLRAGLLLRTDPAALPRLFFVQGGVRVVADPLAILRAQPAQPPVRALIASSDVPAQLDAAAMARGTPTLVLPTIASMRPTQLRATLDAQGAGMLILNEDPSGRWRARIDGRDAAAIRVNGFQTGVMIPDAGQHTIEISRPGPLFGSLR